MIVALVPPLALWGLTRIVALPRGQGDRWLHLAAVGALVGLFAVQLAKAAGLDVAALLLGIAVAAGTGFLVLYVRVPAVATWASYTAVLPILAVGSFLLVSPASALFESVDAPDRTGSGDLPSVVVIVLDELPTRSILDADGGIDAQRFPNLAGFAGDATWYRHHTTVSTLTETAVPAMLTGRLPTTDDALWTNHQDNLFTLLVPTHELEVLEQATQLCPYDVCVPTAGVPTEEGEPAEAIDVGGPGLGDLLGVTRDLWLERVSLGPEEPASFDDFTERVGSDDPVEEPTDDEPSITVPPPRPDGDPAAALSPARADAIIQSFDRGKGPALYYLHLMLPHQPFNRYPDGEQYEVLDPKGQDLPLEDSKQLFSWSPWASAVSEQQHLLQAQYADQVLGHLLTGLRDSGLYDDSLVVVAADHGVSFESHTAGRYVEPSTIDAIGYAPLLIKEPGQREGAIDDANLSSIDLLPTIADRLGLEVSWEVDGAPAGSPTIAERGTAKQIYDMIGFGGLVLRGILDFDDAEAFATVADRSIGPLTDRSDPLSALHARLGLADMVGADLDDLVTDDGGALSLDGLDALQQPAHEGPRRGLVTGIVPDAPDGARLLLAVDDVVVGGSELSTDADGRRGRIAVLLPQGSLDGDNDIRAALVVDGEVVELEVRSS